MKFKLSQKEAGKAWIKELRSGKYEQGKGVLKTVGGKYCCLGVACELFDKIEEKIDIKEDRYNNHSVFSFDGLHASLPKKVQNWLGIDSLGRWNSWNSLAKENDKGIMFPAIANIIEKEWKC
jgi:hypothetical protein